MSRVTNDLINFGPDTSAVFSYLKKNGESIYVFVWALSITVILLNFFNVDMTDHGKKPVFKNVAIYEQFKTACENPGKNCPKKVGKDSCVYNECCVWAKSKNGATCIQGDKDGPEEDNDSKGSKYDEYWYLKKRHNIN